MWVKELVLSFLATLFFGVLFKVPRKAIVVAALIGGLGYVAYRLILPASSITAFFTGAFVIALLSEWAARLIKCPVPLFMMTAVIPLVPGWGLYQTMLYAVQSDMNAALLAGTNTMMGLAAIALAIALVSMGFRLLRPAKHKEMTIHEQSEPNLTSGSESATKG